MINRLYTSEEAEQFKKGPPRSLYDNDDIFDTFSKGIAKKVPLPFEKREFHKFQNQEEPLINSSNHPIVTIKQFRYLFDKKKALESLDWSRKESEAVQNNVKQHKEVLKNSYIYRQERKLAEETIKQQERMKLNFQNRFQKFTKSNN